MGRGGRDKASAATGLLYGRRHARTEQDIGDDLALAIRTADFTLLQRLVPRLSDIEKRNLRQDLAGWAIKEEGGWGRDVLDSFGLRTAWADSIICQDEHGPNAVYHLSRQAARSLDQTLGGIDSPAMTTACGQEVGPRRGESGGLFGDGGRARRGAWMEPSKEGASCCLACNEQADYFPEAKQSGDYLFDGLQDKIAMEIDLDAPDQKSAIISSYRGQFVEAATKKALTDGEAVFKRLYYGSYQDKRGALDGLLGRKMSDKLSEEQWRANLLAAVNGIDERETHGHHPIVDAADNLFRVTRQHYSHFS